MLTLLTMPPTATPSAPESIVPSLDWCKKLKEAGWPQNEDSSVYWWSYVVRAATGEWSWKVNPKQGGYETYAAPTAEEILRRFPEEIKTAIRVNYWPSVGWRVQYDVPNGCACTFGSLADSLAGIYCRLAEQKLLPAV